MEASRSEESERAARPAAGWRDYIAMARPDHWLKHIFILPGVVLAYIGHPVPPRVLTGHVLLGLFAACMAASANYVLNEWLDAPSDRHHPSKSGRPAVATRLSGPLVTLEYIVLAAASLAAGRALSPLFLYGVIAFLIAGVAYNVAPLRLKDRPYLDVASEAVNNPIRLTLGWAMVSPNTLPPSSALLAFWMGGAFLMAVKRLAEHREADSRGELLRLARYRKSFASYSEVSLLLTTFLYAQLGAFFLAVFLIKYRIEYLLSLPFFALLFAAYLRVGLKPSSVAQRPEKLFREPGLMMAIAALVFVLAVLTSIDIPVLDRLTEPHYLKID